MRWEDRKKWTFKRNGIPKKICWISMPATPSLVDDQYTQPAIRCSLFPFDLDCIGWRTVFLIVCAARSICCAFLFSFFCFIVYNKLIEKYSVISRANVSTMPYPLSAQLLSWFLNQNWQIIICSLLICECVCFMCFLNGIKSKYHRFSVVPLNRIAHRRQTSTRNDIEVLVRRVDMSHS